MADEVELEDKINELLGNSEHCAALGSAAMSVVEANKGATQRTAQLVGQTLRAMEYAEWPLTPLQSRAFI